MSKKMFAVPLLIAGITVGGVAGAMVSSAFAASSSTAQGNWGNMMGGSYGSTATGSGSSQNSDGQTGMMGGDFGTNGSANGNSFRGRWARS